MRVADVAVGHVADVHQPAVVHADVDKTAEIDHVEHGAGQFHAGGGAELSTPCLNTGAGRSSRGSRPGTDQLGQDVLQRQRADLQLLGHDVEVHRGDLLGQRRGGILVAERRPARASRSITREATA